MEEEQKLPYPTVGACKDAHSAKLLAPFYAGRRGELACVSQCLYQSIRLSAEQKEVGADMLERIAVDDALHFQLLGKAMLSLGVDPVLSVSPPQKKKWFDTSAVSTACHPATMVLETLMIKRNAVDGYRRAAARAQNPDVQHLLLRIALDEKKHAKALAELYRTLCK